MPLFGKRGRDTQNAPEASVEAQELHQPVDDQVDEQLDDQSPQEAETERLHRSRLRPREDVDLSAGPYDSVSAPNGERLDFGAMAIAPMEGVELRLDVDETGEVITGMTAVFGDDGSAAVQLQVFAAPKTSGIWHGIRREIADAIVSNGGTADEVAGPLGTELHTQMPNQSEDGRVSYAPVRFVGIDGPRWFLRAVLSGNAAIDDGTNDRAMRLIRGVVVRRGTEARAPRELLELTLPPELLAQVQEEPQEASEPGIERMERGPEIAETR